MKRIRIAALVILAAFVVATAVMATVPWGKLFKTTYKIDKDTPLYKAKCAACHVKSNGKGGLNAYGKLLDKKKANKQSLKAVEGKDADEDGFNNLAEIKAGTLPGDKTSKPKTE